MTTIAKEVKDEILSKVKAGEKVADLSRQYGVCDRTIYAWLHRTATSLVSVVEYNRLRKENQELKAIAGALMFQLEKLKKRDEVRIEAEAYLNLYQPNYSRKRLTQTLNLSRSSLYYQRKIPLQDEITKEQILSVLNLHPAYGHRRIAIALNTSKKKIRRVMKKYGLKPYKRKARWRKRRDERRPEATYANLIKDKFPIRPNLIWVSDFTYLKFQNKYLYLATFMDLYTREIVGWFLSDRHTKDLVINAFWDGFKNTGVLPRIIHSDQGSEYNCHDYTHFIETLGVQVSMS